MLEARRRRDDPCLHRGDAASELAFSVNDLRAKIAELTDWRRHLSDTAEEGRCVGAAVAGFVIGGGVAATVSLLTGHRRR